MAVQLHNNDLAARLHAHLVPKLTAGATKRIDDGLWIDFDDAGNVSLAEKPYDFLSCIWEMLVRLFTGKYARIERGICLITAEVNDYLIHERDPVRLGEFINSFTPLVAELYRCATKLARVHRISREVLDHLQAKGRTQELMAPYDHAGVPDRRYKFHGLFSVSSEMRDANVSFRFTNQEGLVGGRGIEAAHGLQFQQTQSSDIKSTGRPVTLAAEVTRRFSSLVEKSAEIFLFPDGNPPDVRSLEGDRGVSFYNRTEEEVRVKIEHLPPDQGEFTIAPRQMHECGVILRAKDKENLLEFSTSYTTVSPPFQIGSPVAHYFVKMNEQGRLVDAEGNFNMKVEPLQGRLVKQEQARLSPGEEYVFNNFNYRCLLANLRDGERRERVFVPQTQIPRQNQFGRTPYTLVRGYESLRNLFGVDWDGSLAISLNVLEPVLAPLVMPTPPRTLLTS